jgi:hypothetical protein
VNLARELQDALSGRRLTGVDMGKDSNISVNTKVFHFTALSFIPGTDLLTHQKGLSMPSKARTRQNARWVHVISKLS